MIALSQPRSRAVLRALLPAALLIPIVFGGLWWLAVRHGGLNPFVGMSLFVVANVLAFVGLVWWSAGSIDRMDRDRRRAERLLTAQNTVTAVLADSPQPGVAVPKILQAVCESIGWEVGGMWRFDPRDGVLRNSDLWAGPTANAGEFAALTRTLALAPGAGLPGRVWAEGKPAWVPDIAADPNFPRARAAFHDRLRSAFAFPVAVDGETLGVMEFYTHIIQKPDDDLLRMFAAVGGQIGQFLKRKQAEEEATAERHLLRSLLDNLPDSVYYKDERSRFIRVSKALATRLGLSDPAEARGKTDADFFSEEHARPAIVDEQEIMRTGRAIVGKEEKETHDGQPDRWVLTTKMPLRDPDGRVIGTFGISRDITARRQAEEALREAEARARLLLDSSGEGIYGIDLQGRCSFVNRAAADVLGYRVEEVLGSDVHALIHHTRADGSPYPLADCPIYQSARLGRGCRVDQEIFWRRDGTSFPAEYSAYPLRGGDGEIKGAVVTFTDITERKEVERQVLKAKEAALSASRAKSEFLANMSHEIRTPLNGIIGMTELALDTELTAEQREYLGLVKTSADHLLTVIGDVLDFSKIEAGKLDLEEIDFDLREVIDDTIATLAVRAHKKGLELIDHVAPDVPIGVAGDPHRLRQVIVNLVGNALKFTDEGEVALDVAVAPEPPAPEAGGEPGDAVWLHFSVRDTGAGIAPEHQRKLFQAFSQADTSTTRKYGGTGLGLAISASLVEMMGGRIWLESELGRGSTFHFLARFRLARTTVARPTELPQVRGLPVLVVDDNATNRRILHEMLNNWGMKPTVVDGGAAALAALEHARKANEPFTLVLLDAMMPEMDGFTLAERIKQNPGLVESTLMMLSSADQRDDAARCRALGVAAYLTKPIRKSVLFDSIMTSLAQSAPTAEPGAPARPAPSRAARGLRLLLAEDNAVNQRLAVAVLEKRGHSVRVAGTGREAIDALAYESFDVVLMDVQMPEMDGFEATRLIREREAGTDRRTPIVAMTAHAMKGDRERCLAAGMDHYVSKPLRPDELFAAIEGLVPAGDAPPPEPSAEPSPAPPPTPLPASGAININEALLRLGENADLLNELVEICLSELPNLLDEIRRAAARKDGPKLQLSAHALKGSVATFAATDTVAAAWALEQIGRDRNWAAADAALANLESAVEALRPALAKLGQRAESV